MQFNYVDHEGYRRVDKRKAKRLFNLGYTIHLIPSNAGINTHHKTISKAKIPDFDRYVQAYKDCFCWGANEYPTFAINVYEIMTEEM